MIIDRFEGEYAVVETEQGIVNILRSYLPESAREGDVLNYSNGSYSVDTSETNSLREEVRDKLHNLLNGNYD